MNRTMLGLALFPILIVFMLIIGLSCGSNPPFAPANSAVTLVDPPQSITIPPNSLNEETVQAFVTKTDASGNTVPINSVRVFFSLSFAGPQDLVEDTNGDGVADAHALQLVNPDHCGTTNFCGNDVPSCECTPIEEQVSMGAFVDSPFETLTDNRGVATVIILMSGNFPVNPATLEANLGNGQAVTAQFAVSNPQ
jgi:hypothetical protein